ncbi:enoyl-CoA hydratase-related protein [Actinomadura sp. LOL_016]|uniref:enoyl-CoA hydratase-related protein n=1 Tax=unclassified Actinomadura TaxID=2626254 RepID=UPI003A7FBA00
MIDLSDGILTLTLNRPEARNALSPGLTTALDAALTRFEEDGDAKVAVITGTGRAFCAGLDLKVFAAADADRRPVGELIRRFGRLSKPIVGAINGPTIAGGLEIALSCDFLIGSPQAMFADTHVKIGAFPGGGTTARLGRAVGIRTAKAMSLGGLRLDARAALRAGLLSEIVEHDELGSRARALATHIATARQELVGVVRRLYDQNAGRSLDDALAVEAGELERWRAHQRLTWSV